jgi:hypothetical protein
MLGVKRGSKTGHGVFPLSTGLKALQKPSSTERGPGGEVSVGL